MTYQNQVLDELLHRCAQHDEAGLARLYELTSPWIYALVTRLTSSRRSPTTPWSRPTPKFGDKQPATPTTSPSWPG